MAVAVWIANAQCREPRVAKVLLNTFFAANVSSDPTSALGLSRREGLADRPEEFGLAKWLAHVAIEAYFEESLPVRGAGVGRKCHGWDLLGWLQITKDAK